MSDERECLSSSWRAELVCSQETSMTRKGARLSTSITHGLREARKKSSGALLPAVDLSARPIKDSWLRSWAGPHAQLGAELSTLPNSNGQELVFRRLHHPLQVYSCCPVQADRFSVRRRWVFSARTAR